MINYILNSLAVAFLIGLVFFGWRYYDRFDWCRENVQQQTNYTVSEREVGFISNGGKSTLLHTSPQTVETESYYYSSGEKYNSYEEAFSKCKSEWVDYLI